MKYDEMLDFINHEVKEQHITLAELTRRTYIKERTINNYLLKNRMMPADAMLSLLNALGKPLKLITTKKVIDDKVVRLDA